MVGLGWWTCEHVTPGTDAVDTCETTVLVTGSPEVPSDLADGHETIEHVISYEEYDAGAATEAYDAVYG